jgi:hypothetical protein
MASAPLRVLATSLPGWALLTIVPARLPLIG